MRDYGKLYSSFWTGPTGKAIRSAGDDTLIVALYLISNPHTNMIGFYYLPLPLIAHETGRTIEGASEALRCCGKLRFAHYDFKNEHVWVREMAKFQIGDDLHEKDKRLIAIQRLFECLPSGDFIGEFFKRYEKSFRLNWKPHRRVIISPIEAPSKPHRSHEHEQEQEKEQEKTPPVSPPRGTFDFDAVWLAYPKRDGRKAAERHFKSTVLTSADFADIQTALKNYLGSRAVKSGYVKNGSTWFNNWRDWIDFTEPELSSANGNGHKDDFAAAMAKEKEFRAKRESVLSGN